MLWSNWLYLAPSDNWESFLVHSFVSLVSFFLARFTAGIVFTCHCPCLVCHLRAAVSREPGRHVSNLAVDLVVALLPRCVDLRGDTELFLLPSKINLALSGQGSCYLPRPFPLSCFPFPPPPSLVSTSLSFKYPSFLSYPISLKTFPLLPISTLLFPL